MKLGLIGFGTVGGGVVSLLAENSRHIFDKTGISLELKTIADSDPGKKNYAKKIDAKFTLDANEIINDPEISVVIEAVGGINPALKFISDAIKNGKHIVTSNKELLAKHGEEIFSLAKKNNVRVLFEGAVAGGIPVINQLRTSLCSNRIEEIYGIVNGTTNYILSKMSNENIDFDVALKEAQRLGFAEADPKNDIEGFDALYKAVILAEVAYDIKIDINKVYFEGIGKITLKDIRYANDLGYAVKLLAIIKKFDSEIEIRVHPALILKNHLIALVDGSFNAVFIKGNEAGELMFYGRGAGAGPTASSIIGDVIEIAQGCKNPYYPKYENRLMIKSMEESENSYYIRLEAFDRPGVLADVSGIFGSENVSIKEVLQKDSLDKIATVVIITHRVREKNIFNALKKISDLKNISSVGNVIRVGME